MANYLIIGGDGKEYGPVSEADMRQWIIAGRVNAASLAKTVNDAEFRPLSVFPEFADALAPSATIPTVPPPLAAAPATNARTSRLAITSLILGILGLFTCGITALVGLVLGIIALTKVKSSDGKLGGNGIALAGIIVSAIFLFMIPLFAAMLLPALAQAKQKAQQINCVNNEKQLALAILIYSGDNKDKFPNAATWCDDIKELASSEKVFKCISANSDRRCDYAFNAKLGGQEIGKINPQTVMIFEADSGWNASGGPELVTTTARHGRRNGNPTFAVAFADGHVETLPKDRLKSLRWDP